MCTLYKESINDVTFELYISEGKAWVSSSGEGVIVEVVHTSLCTALRDYNERLWRANA